MRGRCGEVKERGGKKGMEGKGGEEEGGEREESEGEMWRGEGEGRQEGKVEGMRKEEESWGERW